MTIAASGWEGTNLANEARELAQDARMAGETEVAQELEAAADDMEDGLVALDTLRDELERLRDDTLAGR